MDLDFAPEDAAFRQEVRTCLYSFPSAPLFASRCVDTQHSP